jgi:hypothetical protein
MRDTWGDGCESCQNQKETNKSEQINKAPVMKVIRTVRETARTTAYSEAPFPSHRTQDTRDIPRGTAQPQAVPPSEYLVLSSLLPLASPSLNMSSVTHTVLGKCNL